MDLRRLYHSSMACILLALLGFVFPTMVVASIGINYGQIANDLPLPQNAIPLVQSIGANKVKLFDADSRVLRAFANTGIEIAIGLQNNYISDMQNPEKALTWVVSNVQAYLPDTKITTIMVGNEVLTSNDTSLSDNLVLAMQSLYTALIKLGLDKKVSVTTPHSFNILKTSYPPSSGTFRQDLINDIRLILDFHVQTGSPFLINVYPFFAYKANPSQVPLDYVMFRPNQGVIDPVTGLHYDNMLFAQIDAVYSAIASLGYPSNLPVYVSETGWPSKGDDDEVGATLDNAKEYNGNLMKLVAEKMGTPMRPTTDLNVYVFALFNENMKPGPTSERNYGLFKSDGKPAYLSRNTTNSGDSLTIANSARERHHHVGLVVVLYLLAGSILL